MIDDSVPVRCIWCKTVFRDRATRLQSGYSRQCPSCEVILFFEHSSNEANIKRAMASGRKKRAELREADFLKPRKARSVPTEPSC